MSISNHLLTLIVVEKNQDKLEFDLTKKVTLIGRRTNDIILSHPSISGSHASLEMDGTGLNVKDLNSKKWNLYQRQKNRGGAS